MNSPCVNCGADAKVCKECDWYNGVWISKDQYKARLKADMAAMLEELLKELKELPKACFYKTNELGDVTGYIDYPAISKNALDLIQQKIDKLKEE